MSNRGRKTSTPAEAVPDTTNHEALARAGLALTEFAKRSTEIAVQYADGVPYERERVISEAKYLMAASAEAMLEAGKRLIQIKENEPYGDFVEIVTTRLGLAPRTAQRMMTASVKFLAPALAPKAKAFALLGKTKLFDLAFEDEGELEELAEGGTLAGHTLDDIDAMTSRELREALRETREDVVAKDRLLDDKNKKIDKLTADKKFKPSAQSAARNAEEAAQLEELGSVTNGCEIYFLKLANVVEALQNESQTKAVRERALQAVQFVAMRMAELLERNGIEVNLADTLAVRPAWLTSLPDAEDLPAGTGGGGGTGH